MPNTKLEILAESKGPTTLSIHPSEIKVVPPMVDEDNKVKEPVKLDILGTSLILEMNAEDNLFDAIGYNKKARKTLDKKYEGARFDELNKILEKADKNDKELTLVMANEKSLRVGRVVSQEDKTAAIDRNALLEMLQYAVTNAGLIVEGVSMNEDLTKATINVNWSDLVTSPFEGMLDETIQLGRSFDWDMYGDTSAWDYVLRQICGNGMIGTERLALDHLTSTSKKETWFNLLFKDVNTDSHARRYFQRVKNSMRITPSAYEYFQVLDLLKKYDGAETKIKIKEMLPSDGWINFWIEKGYDLTKPASAANGCTTRQKMNIEAPGQTRWDLFNVLTDVISHEYDSKHINEYQRNQDKIAAGKAFARDADAYNWNPLAVNIDYGSWMNN